VSPVPIRILIVDDSVVVRRSLTTALAGQPPLTIVGSAASGRIALMKIPLLRPDLVLLTFDMPGDDGRETVAAIRTGYPDVGVVLLSARAGRSTAATAGARALGCLGCAVRPDPAHGTAAGVQRLVEDLAALLAASPLGRGDRALLEAGPRRRSAAQRVDVVAIGASTGGPSALTDLLPKLAGDFPVPIVVVQHMPPAFTRLLAERIDAKCRIRVGEAESRQVLAPGQASIAPGDFHMTVERERDGAAVRVAIGHGPRENSCRPSVDVLFRSVARAYGPHALAVVMTGMGQDGVAGCREIRSAGGQVIVQDESSSVVWGMPGLVVKADLADQIVPLHGLAAAIAERVRVARAGMGDLVGR
jgi:two-component system, chemotaxis family, protein-glutamate methylesterase/glutaminase